MLQFGLLYFLSSRRVFVALRVVGLSLCTDAYSRGRPGFVCRFCPVCPWGILIVTSLVVGFLGYTLELFCNVFNLPVIIVIIKN